MTPKEREILPLLISPKTVKEIGSILGISQTTVSVHINNICKFYSVASRLELIFLYLKENLGEMKFLKTFPHLTPLRKVGKLEDDSDAADDAAEDDDSDS